MPSSRRMRTAMRGLLVAGVLATGTVAWAQGPATGAAAVIAERREGLKRMNAHLEAMKPVADARGDVAALVPRLDDMIAWFQTFPTRFPAGSDVGDTKARPAVWSERPGFETANAGVLTRLEALKTAAASGNAAAFADGFATIGPQGCGGCHRTYRAR